MTAVTMWLEVDWEAPERALRALEGYARSVRLGDPAQLKVAAGPLTEQEAFARLMELMNDDAELAPRVATLPDVVICEGGVPEDVEDHLRLPGPGESGLRVLREELAPYVALTPVLNQEEWARSFKPEPGFRHLVVDNASDDDTAAILAERGAEVVVNERRLSRVENWRRAVEVFLELGDRPWMKWLFAGDRLLPGAADVLDRAIAAHPTARVVSAEYHWKHPDGGVTRFRTVGETKLVQPAEALYRFVVQGNWMGGPLAIAMHRDVLPELEFGSHAWVADWQASLSAARRLPVLAVAEPVGLFDASRARYHSAHEADVSTIVQDVAMRYQALEQLREIAPAVDVTEIERKLDESALAGIASRVQAKRNAAAPAARRVALAEAPAAGGASRMRLGGKQPARGSARR